MSGAEPLAILGAISSIIAVLEATKNLYEAAKDVQGLHDTFRKVSDSVPLILRTLRQAEAIQERNVEDYSNLSDAVRRQAILEESRALGPVMVICQSSAEALSGIFASAMPKDGESRFLQYVKATRSVLSGQKRRVAQLLGDIMEKLQLLHTYHSFRAMSTASELQAKIKQNLELRDVSPVAMESSTSSAQPRSLTVNGDDTPLSECQEPRIERIDISRPRHRVRDSENKLHVNEWSNANGTKVVNQSSLQNIHGGQNITM